MNYIEQINLLHKIRRKDSLGPIAVTMYVILLDICNRDDWENPFNLKNDKILSDLDVTFNTLAATRNKLQQSGLIKFRTRNGTAEVIYTILDPEESKEARSNPTFSKFDEVAHEVTDEVTAKVAHKVTAKVPNSVNGININKTKQKQKKPIAEAKAPPGPDKIYASCMKIYFEWFEARFSIAPKIDALQGKALKDIIRYLSDIVKKKDEAITEDDLDEKVKTNWQGILESWDQLEEFYQKQTKLNQISSNIQNLIVQIKKALNGHNKQHGPQKSSTPIWRQPQDQNP